MFRHDLKHTGRSNYTGSDNNSLQWVYAVGSSTSTPAIGTDSTIYVGSHDTNLYAIHANGTLKWKFQTGDSIESSPAVGTDGVIYVGSNDNYIYAIKPDGTLKWKYLTNDNIVSSPAIGTNSTIYVGSYDGYLYVMNRDGTLKKSPPPSLGNQIYSSPAVGDNEVIYVGSKNNNKLYSFDSNLSTRWSRQLLGQIESSPAIDSSGTVYIGADRLYAFTGSDSYWTYTTTNGLPVTSSPAISAKNEIYFGAESGFYALYSTNNEKRLVNTIGAIGKSSPAIDAEGNVYICSDKGLYALDTNYNVKWTYPIKDGDASPVIGSDGTIYVHSSDGNLYAVGTTSAVVHSISTDKTSLSITDGKSDTLKATLYDAVNLPLPDITIKTVAENSLIASVTPGSATSDANGQATFTIGGSAVGKTTLTLTANNSSVTVPVAVSPRSRLTLHSLEVNPGTVTISKNESDTITVKTLDANEIRIPNVYVMTTNSNAGSVSIEEGLVTDEIGEASFQVKAVGEGYTSITFTANGVSGTATVIVAAPYSIELEPSSLEIKENQSKEITAIVKDKDGNALGNQTVTAEISDTDVVSADSQQITDENGEALFTVTGVGSGITDIAFSTGSATASLPVTVISINEVTALDTKPNTLRIPLGFKGAAQITALDEDDSPLTGINVSAESDDSTVATVDSSQKTDADGQALFGIDGVSPGSTTVRFTANNVTATLPISIIEITPSSLSVDIKQLRISENKSGTITAKVLDRNKSPVSYLYVEAQSNDTSIVTIDSNKATNSSGKAFFSVFGKSSGTADITFGVGTLSASTTVTVAEPVASKIKIDGNTATLSQCENTDVAVSVLDNSNEGVSNVTVTASLITGNSKLPRAEIEPSQSVTDENGEASFTITGLRTGKDFVKFSTDNLHKKLKINVQKTRIVSVGKETMIIITVLQNGKPKSGVRVFAKSSDTDVVTVNKRKTTNQNGEARFTAQGIGEGSASITFSTNTNVSGNARVFAVDDTTSGSGTQLIENVVVIKTADVELSDSNVSIPVGSSTVTTITATDADNDPVPDVNVYASVVKGEKNIAITASQQTTDENGQASLTIEGVKAGNATVNTGVCGLSHNIDIEVLP
jgi:outer membrane protein assembly factor BamB